MHYSKGAWHLLGFERSLAFMNRAVVYVILSTTLYAVINLAVKYLHHLPASELVVFRASVSFLLCFYFLKKKKMAVWGHNKKLLILRGLTGTLALFSLFTVLQKIPFAVAMTLINLTPIFTVIIAHVFLREKANLAQWIFLVLSFMGVIMIRGGIEPVPWLWMFLGMGAALFAAITYTIIRQLRKTDDALVVILYFPMVTIPLISPVMISQWQTPQGLDWVILLTIGVLTQVAQYFMTLAYQAEKAAKVMVFNYISILWGLLFGWILFSETLSLRQILGVTLIFACLLGNYWVSHRHKTPLRPRQITES